MGTINCCCITTRLSTNLCCVVSTCCTEQLVYTSLSMDIFQTDRCAAIPRSQSLPSPSTTCTPDGELTFFEAMGVPVVVNNQTWQTLDGKCANPASTLWMWGRNPAGMLGTNNITQQNSPVTTVANCANWQCVSMGFYHTLALRSNGELFAFGCNSSGQLGTNNTINRSSPVSVSTAEWFRASAGNNHSLAIKNSGTLWSWGSNANGQLGLGNTANTSTPGSVLGGFSNWCQISTSIVDSRSAGVRSDGTLWTWGTNNCGQLGIGLTSDRSSPVTTCGGGTNWCMVQTNGQNANSITAAIKTDGTLWTWGPNSVGQLGTGNTTSRSSPDTTAGNTCTWCTVSLGNGHVLGIRNNCMLAWGWNSLGQLGDTTTVSRSSPVQIGSGYGTWSKVSAGGRHSLGITAARQILTWGNNNYGQLGKGNSGIGTCTCFSPGSGRICGLTVTGALDTEAGYTSSSVLFLR